MKSKEWEIMEIMEIVYFIPCRKFLFFQLLSCIKKINILNIQTIEVTFS